MRQAELPLGRPDDFVERAANRVAAGVAGAIDGAPVLPGAARGLVGTAGGGDDVSGSRAPTGFTSQVRDAQGDGGGQLPSALRLPMERAFAADLSRVRIHDDGRAAELASRVHARAFTVGSDVFFARGALAPDRPRGRRLLAHELAHVVQAGSSRGTTIRRSTGEGEEASETSAPYRAGDVLTQEEFEDTFRRARRLAPGTIAMRISADSGEHLVVPESAVDKTATPEDQQHIVVSFKNSFEGKLWEAKIEEIKERRRTALAARRIAASDKMIGAFGVAGVLGGVALGSGLLGAGLVKLGGPALLAGGYTFLDADPANAPGPGDPTYARKNPAQRATEAALFALPAARLARGGATTAEMMLWGGGSALGMQAVQDVGRGERSPLHAYAGRGLGGAVGWGLPTGAFNAVGSGVRGRSLYATLGGLGLATGLGLRGAHDLEAGQISGPGDYAAAGGVGLGVGLLGAATVTGLDFVATTAVVRSNQAISAGIPADQSMTVEGLRRLFGRRPDLAGRLGQRWLGARSSMFPGNLVPRQGTANIGGGMETPQYSNVNPLMTVTGGPEMGVPNHVLASFEQIDVVFQPGAVTKIISNRLPAETVDWARASQAAHRVMAPGGTLQLNVWSRAEAKTAEILAELERAGFKNVRLGGTMQLKDRSVPFKSPETGPGVVVSATR